VAVVIPAGMFAQGLSLKAQVQRLFAGGVPGLMVPFGEISSLYQDAARTTLVSAAGDPIGSASDLSGNSKHLSQATAAARPVWQPSYGAFDGTDDWLWVDAPGLPATVDVFISVFRTTTADLIPVWGEDTTKFLACCRAGSSTSPTGGASGAPSYFVDGVEVVGATRDTLNTAMTTGMWHVLEIRNANLSSWTRFAVSGRVSFYIRGQVADVVAIAAQDSAGRALIRKYLGSNVGLSL
jgi:hypothetical protein